MKAAPYTRETLDRIRQGASAAMLGWDQQFYSTVCRRHELTAVNPPPPVVVAPPIAPPPIVPSGGYSFEKSTRVLRRGVTSATLTRRQAEMLLVFIAQPGKSIQGADYAERIGISASNVSSYVNQLRGAVEPVGLYVLGIMGRRVGGYLLIDQKTREPAVIHVVTR